MNQEWGDASSQKEVQEENSSQKSTCSEILL